MVFISYIFLGYLFAVGKKQFGLKEFLGHFPYVAEENNRTTVQLSDFEKFLNPVKCGNEELSIYHLKAIKSDMGFVSCWKIPEVEEKELESLEGMFCNLEPLDLSVISALFDLLKNIEIVSVILRCIDPRNYGIISHP